MEAKVNALKLPELRNALKKAGVAFGSKANKADLVAKVLASPEALAALGLSQPPSQAGTEAGDDLLAPPAEFDWDGDAAEPPNAAAAPATAKPASAAKPASKAAPAPAATPATASTTTSAPSTVKATPAVAATPANNPPVPATTTTDKLDEEEEKRKKRAERFGITYTPSATPTPAVPKHPHHPKNAKTPKAPAAAPKAAAAATPIDQDPEKLKARAARFGLKPETPTSTPVTSATSTPTAKGHNKRPAAEPVDPEEEERRRKRAERFAIPVATK